MKRLLFTLVTGIFILSACEQKGKVPQSQTQFLERLHHANDTATLFKTKEAIRTRIITNMSRYVAANTMTFSDWSFTVVNLTDTALDLKTPLALGVSDTTIFDVKFVLLTANSSPEVKDKLAKVKVGDKIKVDGEMAMKTADGKVSMNSYFADSTQYIKIIPKAIK